MALLRRRLAEQGLAPGDIEPVGPMAATTPSSSDLPTDNSTYKLRCLSTAICRTIYGCGSTRQNVFCVGERHERPVASIE